MALVNLGDVMKLDGNVLYTTHLPLEPLVGIVLNYWRCQRSPNDIILCYDTNAVWLVLHVYIYEPMGDTLKRNSPTCTPERTPQFHWALPPKQKKADLTPKIRLNNPHSLKMHLGVSRTSHFMICLSFTFNIASGLLHSGLLTFVSIFVQGIHSDWHLLLTRSITIPRLPCTRLPYATVYVLFRLLLLYPPCIP